MPNIKSGMNEEGVGVGVGRVMLAGLTDNTRRSRIVGQNPHTTRMHESASRMTPSTILNRLAIS